MTIQLIGAACSVGGKHRGCREAPDALMARVLPALSGRAPQPLGWKATLRELDPEGAGAPQAIVADFCWRLAAVVGDVLRDGDFPVILGGDHSCAIGTWSAVARERGAAGLLWIDAHLDSHTPETSESGAIHGMPLAFLLGEGRGALVGLCGAPRAILPAHTCVVGARSYEAAEPALLSALGVRIYTMEDVRARGLQRVLGEAYALVSASPTGFGISVDLDVIDPEDAPGVSIREPTGILAAELLDALATLPRGEGPMTLEIAEYNPWFDEEERTADLAIRIIEAVCRLRDETKCA